MSELMTLDQWTNLLVTFGKNLLPEDDHSQGSDNWKRIRILAGACTDLSSQQQSIERDRWADTAKEVALARGGELKGVPRLGAIQATGTDAGLIKGVIGATWLVTDVLVHPNGQRYLPTAGGTIGATGQELVDLAAETGGLAGNLEETEVLSWDTTPTDLEDEVELQADIDGGADLESLGAYRTRVLNREAQGAQGGNDNDYEQWIVESDENIATGYVWPDRNGSGSTDIAGLKAGSGSVRLLDASERATLLAYVEARRPSGAKPRVLEVLAELQDCEILLDPQPTAKFARDWNDTTPLVVSTWTAASKTLVFTTDRPDGMKAGHRIVVRGTSGIQLEIESLSGTYAVVLVDAKGQTPAGAQDVYSGGPIVTTVRNGVLALFDSLGPRWNEYGSIDRSWVSTLYHSHVFRVAQNSDGVLDSEVTTPVSDAEPTLTSYPVDDSQINLLVPGNVLVRYR